jgi:general secretion pathway protein D
MKNNRTIKHAFAPALPTFPVVRATAQRWNAYVLSASVALAPAPLLAQNAPNEPGSSATLAAGMATLNFVGADIESVIKAVGQLTGRTFIIDPRVKGTINLVSEKPVSKAQAFNLLTSALRLQGYAVVTVDGYTKVVPEPDAKLQAGPTQVGGLHGDQIVTRIFRLNYESSTNMVAVLRPLISPNNTISANPGTNSLVITDYADNLARLDKIIAALDAPATGDLDVVPMKYAIASDIAVLVNRLMEPTAGAVGADAGRVSLLADVRTNSIVIRAPSVARANLAKSLINKLDQPTAQPGNVHVVYLRNADAVKLAQTLRAVVASESGGTSGAAGPTTGQNQNAMPQNANQPAGATATPLASAGPNNLPSGGAAGYIQADAATNTLIITSSETQYRNLRAVIDQLDARRAQVYIESLIVEVTANNTAELGIQWLAATGDSTSTYRLGGGTGFNSGGNNLITQAGTKAAGGALALPTNGLTLGLFRQIGGQLGLGALAHALETDGHTNILSIPNLITLDNEEARIIVGQNVPFITGQYTTPASGTAAGVSPFQTIERKDIGLSLRVKPQVSEGGTVKLAIYQENSSIDPSVVNSGGIITKKRSIETNVLVDDGQIIVLGGLIEDNVGGGVEKVPFLGDIPFIGGMFKYSTRNRTKTNLMVFLRPIVLRNAEQSANVVSDRYDYMRRAQQGTEDSGILLPQVATPSIPPLQEGNPSGGAMIERRKAPTIEAPKATPQKVEP